MSKISEQELIEEVRRSQAYRQFVSERLPPKLGRERKAWELLVENRGQYTQDILNQIFDTVDLEPNNSRWFGELLGAPNRGWIFEAEPARINEWIEELLFSGTGTPVALNTCMGRLRIKGASRGLASLFLYLSSVENFNVWVPRTERGLEILGRINKLRGRDWGVKYAQFNTAAVEFRKDYGFQSQEIDFVLWQVCRLSKTG